MMNTPICDFVKKYADSDALRLHMPGHKGKGTHFSERLDITEISGADSLYSASGIIAESEGNASKLFGAHSFYSCEGSSLCIRAMLYLLKLYGVESIIAARNVHKAFITAAAMLDINVIWLYGENASYLSCDISLDFLGDMLSHTSGKTAVYVTSPDYLGSIADIKAISALCREHGALLCVDNAHGAYLKFLENSLHPIDLGADICCDSAHKTLPVLTGGAYLHISNNAPSIFRQNAKNALSLFGSTSPSYLILQSLDAANAYIENGYKERLGTFAKTVEEAKAILKSKGFTLSGNEPLKITVNASAYGYCGTELAKRLEGESIFCEFADRDNIVFMLTPENGEDGANALLSAICNTERKEAITAHPPRLCRLERVLSFREAIFAESETVPAAQSEGAILSQFNIACPPAVPIVVCGERISKSAVEAFEYYGIDAVSVVSRSKNL